MDETSKQPPSKAIRVLRVLEYYYSDRTRPDGTVQTAAERMADDLTRWAVPPTGATSHGNMVIRSAVFLPEVTESPDEPDDHDPRDDLSHGA